MKEFTYDEVSAIVESARDESEINKNYRVLYKGILNKFWEERNNKGIYFTIYIKPNIIDIMEFNIVKDNLTEIERCIHNCNMIEINQFGNVINSEYKDLDTCDMKKELCNLSFKNYVFFFGEEGITPYQHGSSVEDRNFFYSSEDKQRYLEKKDISQISKVIKEYATKELTQQVNYMVFFADNTTLNQIDPSYIKRNILRNKPEHYMRDHLKNYLSDNMKYTFIIEPELGQSKRKLDIYFDVKGQWNFIEIKWLGVSVNDKGTGLNNPCTDHRAREGVKQSLEYIEELIKTSNVNLRCGYLAIFDARDIKNKIDFQEYGFVDENLRQYMQYFGLFEIPVDKRHSA